LKLVAVRQRAILLFMQYRPADRPIGLTGQENPMAKLNITVNKVKCISSEDCVESAPAVFRLDDAGKSEVYNPTGAPDAAIMAAARGCPVKAITVVDEETGTQLFPPPKK
jgi:ferredoxin